MVDGQMGGALGGRTIAPDSWSTVADLEVGDYNTADGPSGYWAGRPGADVIRLNDRFFSGYSTTDRHACSSTRGACAASSSLVR